MDTRPVHQPRRNPQVFTHHRIHPNVRGFRDRRLPVNSGTTNRRNAQHQNSNHRRKLDMTFTTRAAQDVERGGFKQVFPFTEEGGRRYANYLERTTLDHAARFPKQANYFMTRTLREALQNNDGK